MGAESYSNVSRSDDFTYSGELPPKLSWKFYKERHPQFALGVMVCVDDIQLAVGPWVIGFERRAAVEGETNG